MKKGQARLRVVLSDGSYSGYKSGRRRWRETPVADSTASTRSAGTRSRSIQLDTVLCPPNLSARAKADWPPAISQASSNAANGVSASSVISMINAQTDNCVNADSGKWPSQNGRMPKAAVFAASAFWKRLEECLGEKWSPLNPNSLASRLKMSQGSVYRWYRGQGLPELETALYLSKEGGVCVDWLLNNVKPKYPISKDPVVKELFEITEDLKPEARDRVLRAAKGELLQQREQENEQVRSGSIRHGRV